MSLIKYLIARFLRPSIVYFTTDVSTPTGVATFHLQATKTWIKRVDGLPIVAYNVTESGKPSHVHENSATRIKYNLKGYCVKERRVWGRVDTVDDISNRYHLS